MDKFIACIWPRADFKKNKEIIYENLKDCHILYEKEYSFKFNKFSRFIYQIYHMHPWVGNAGNHYLGSIKKGINCYAKGGLCHFIVFEADSTETVLNIKREIRDKIGCSNHSIHITDDSNETSEIENIILSDNSLSFILEGKPDRYASIERKIKKFVELADNNGISRDAYAFDSSAILGMYGLRRPRDIDFITTDSNCAGLKTKDTDCHNGCEYYDLSVEDMINNPENYFWWNGNKYISLKIVRDMKNARGEKKDKRDVYLIDNGLHMKLRHFIPIAYFRICNDIMLFARFVGKDILGLKRKPRI